MTQLTQELVKSLFNYRDGILYWKKIDVKNQVKIGDKAGTLNDGRYYRTKINIGLHYNHRIIFLYHHGYLPKQIDHIDQNKLNNKIENLREATHSQNGMNRKSCKNTSSKYKGVSWIKCDNMWIAQIGMNNKLEYIDRFKSEIEAALAYNKCAIKLFGGYANLNKIEEQDAQE